MILLTEVTVLTPAPLSHTVKVDNNIFLASSAFSIQHSIETGGGDRDGNIAIHLSAPAQIVSVSVGTSSLL